MLLSTLHVLVCLSLAMRMFICRRIYGLYSVLKDYTAIALYSEIIKLWLSWENYSAILSCIKLWRCTRINLRHFIQQYKRMTLYSCVYRHGCFQSVYSGCIYKLCKDMVLCSEMTKLWITSTLCKRYGSVFKRYINFSFISSRQLIYSWW